MIESNLRFLNKYAPETSLLATTLYAEITEVIQTCPLY